MSRKVSLVTLALAAGLVAGACTDQPLTTALNEAAPAPSFDIGFPGYLNGPGNPGNSSVFRIDTGDGNVFFNFTNDPARDLLTLWFDAPNSALFGCGGEPFNPSDLQALFTGNGILQALTTLQDVPIYVYRNSTFSPDCADLANNWLYAGHASMINTDNDFNLSGSRANAFGWTGQGDVCDQAGDSYNYHEHQTAVFQPALGRFRFLLEDIKITGPLGGDDNCV